MVRSTGVWSRYRRAVALLEAALITGLPFLRVREESALRFDLVNLKLHVLGTVVWISEFHLVLLAAVFLLMLFVAVTAVFGRVWCGWLCPQTVLLDLVEDAARLLGTGRPWLLSRLLLLPLSALVSLTLIWYFVPPGEAVTALFSSRLVTGFFLVQWVVIYLELAFLGRRFCTTVCPYSMLQSTLFDRDTLVVAFDPSRRTGCKGCDACARACPAGIDIKEGLQRECIACARCVDACVAMTRRRGIPSLVDYAGRVWRPKAAALGALAAAFGLTVLVVMLLRPPVDFTVVRDPRGPAPGVNSYAWSVRNSGRAPYDLELAVREPYELIGEARMAAPPHSLTRGRVMVRGERGAGRVRFVLRGAELTLEREAGFL